jgi:dihydroflavonol-4-reductase
LIVLLTGGTGFLGKSVARAVAGRGHAVRVLARGTSDLPGCRPRPRSCAATSPTATAMLRAARGCGAVCHMAALVRMWTPDRARFDLVSVSGQRHALLAARETGARIVYTSSFIAVGPAGPEPAHEPQRHPGRGYRNDDERTKALADAAASVLGFALWAWAELTGHPPPLTHEVVNVFREHWAFSSARVERSR